MMQAISISTRQFLVRCLRAFLAAEAAPLTAPFAEAEWKALLELAAFHRVAPLLHKSLRAGTLFVGQFFNQYRY